MASLIGNKLQPLYVDLASESDDPHVTELTSLCMVCQEMGITRLLMTKIPHYKEVILTSFECVSCGNRNNGIQTANIQDFGINYKLSVVGLNDLNRQLIKSDKALVSIPEIELEIPAEGERGEVTTVEGIIRNTIDGLSRNQDARLQQDPDTAQKVSQFLIRLKGLLEIKEPFSIEIDDPSGNSFIEPLEDVDLNLKKKAYKRNKEQNAALCYEDPLDDETSVPTSIQDLKDEVLVFNSLCDRCARPVQTNMKVVQIPHFKEVIIMATTCDECGNRTNEVKSGSGISPKGKKITLRLTDPCDMARDVLKSETCNITIPELELYIGGGLLGGKFTTLEGLLYNILDDLKGNPFLMGDSAKSDRKDTMIVLLQRIQEIIDGTLPATFVMDDPAGNSYLQNIYAPDNDPEITIDEYERNFEQNEELGINDMKTENYTET